MSTRVKVYADEATARRQHAALSQAVGYPAKGVNVGRGPHVEIPDEPTRENIAGWTTELTELVETREGFGVVVTDRVEAMQGKRETIDGARVTIDVSGAKDVKAEDVLAPERVATLEDDAGEMDRRSR
jgi:hypothetical protein